MQARDPHEPHRVATPLELLFDLCFVVAIAQAAARLHHDLAEAHVGHALAGYAMVFFAIWWAWVNFTWFASAYDTDDVAYRLATFTQIAGVLVLAAGVPRAFDQGDFMIVVVGYVIMRIALVAQWLRAARSDPERRATALTYATGVVLCQIGWIAIQFTPQPLPVIGWVVLAACELAVPVVAERRGETPWHAHHIAERHGLLTLIVLGESVLATINAIQSALADEHAFATLWPIVVGGLLTIISMWWLYFERAVVASSRDSFRWGYGHYLVFASAAAVGAGLAVGVDATVGHAHVGALGAGLAVSVPVALFVLATWAIQLRAHEHGALERATCPVCVLLVLGCALTPWPALAIGIVLAATVALRIAIAARRAD
ncbi:Hypothetical protein I5071_78790 [Sandaracinus amylolyticus]|nr:Hypothetical protein I5071_78790 [Sandaracinus amylolyticus]